MGTYNDFLRLHDSTDSRVRRLYWVYGEEDLFRVLVANRIKKLADVQQFNTTYLNASENSESEIWAVLNQHPLDSDQQRLLFVQNAERLSRLEEMVAWLKDPQTTRGCNATVVFLSNDSEWEAEEREFVSKSSTAMIVKCALPKDPSDRLKRAQDIICAWGDGNITRTNAGVLAQRVNFDMAEAHAVMRKAALFPEAQVNVGAIELLAPRRIEDDIVWALVTMQKRLAAEALSEVSITDAGKIIGALSTHVEMLARLNGVMVVSNSARDAARRVRGKEQYVRRLYPYARFYPRREAVRRTLLLSRMDRAYSSGSREGVLESLVALW